MSPTNNNFLGTVVNRISKGIWWKRATPVVKGKKGGRAFTLIELLAVIAIIGLLAGVVLGTAGIATEKSRQSRIRTELNRLVSDIESYKAAMGNYPPDNQNSNLSINDPKQYHERCGKNSLFYELSGCTFDSASGGTFTTQNKADSVAAKELKEALGVKGVENSARNKKDIPWRGVSFKPNQFADIEGFNDVDILIVPVDKGPFLITAKDGKRKLNPWLYDASSTNRHNMESFDLWTEYEGRNGKTNIIGNW
jgi:prepilin-type N-terminal cleavage/methylation domain-containing protein